MKKEWDIRKQEYERELQRVDAENEQLGRENEEALEQKASLSGTVNVLTMQINEVKHENLELNGRIADLNEELKEIPYLKQVNIEMSGKLNERTEQLLESRSLIESLNAKVRSLEEEIDKILKQSNDEIENLKSLSNRHEKCEEIIEGLNQILVGKDGEIFERDMEIERLNRVVFQQSLEIDHMKEKMKQNESNANFKEFIAMKRELNALKQEKEERKVPHVGPTSCYER